MILQPSRLGDFDQGEHKASSLRDLPSTAVFLTVKLWLSKQNLSSRVSLASRLPVAVARGYPSGRTLICSVMLVLCITIATVAMTASSPSSRVDLLCLLSLCL